MKVSKTQRLGGLPEEPADSLLPKIREDLAAGKRKIVVLDDDPTGTQTVHDTPVLTQWSVDTLCDEFSGQANLFYILTNSRSLSQPDAVALAKQIGTNLVEAAKQTRSDFTVVSRSDSTLRGHYPAEVNALAVAIGQADAIHVIMPFFLQGGRYTIDDIHYLAEGDDLVPAAETPFARDATFGFTQSNLIDWVIEKHAGQFDRDRIHAIGLSDLRKNDGGALAEQFQSMSPGDVCIVNAASMRDVQAFVVAARHAEALGKTFIYRTAASFVQAYAGLEPQPLLDSAEMINPSVSAGLIVAGSYVPKTTAQLETLLQSDLKLQTVDLDVDRLLGGDATTYIDEQIGAVNRHLRSGRHVVLQTSRRLVTGTDADRSLKIGNTVSAAVVKVVRGIDQPLRFLIAKGGITSSDVATQGLDVRRAMVLGQILPGVPVWRLQDESRMPGLAYVVFPGNVGNDNALLEATRKLL